MYTRTQTQFKKTLCTAHRRGIQYIEEPVKYFCGQVYEHTP